MGCHITCLTYLHHQLEGRVTNGEFGESLFTLRMVYSTICLCFMLFVIASRSSAESSHAGNVSMYPDMLLKLKAF